jgi:membrane-bound ClpP family serine protease
MEVNDMFEWTGYPKNLYENGLVGLYIMLFGLFIFFPEVLISYFSLRQNKYLKLLIVSLSLILLILSCYFFEFKLSNLDKLSIFCILIYYIFIIILRFLLHRKIIQFYKLTDDI